MKKLTFKTTAIFASLVLACFVWFTSCRTLHPTNQHLANTWSKLFSERATSFLPDQIVCPSLADESISEYKKLYPNRDSNPLSAADMVKAYNAMTHAYTENVAFGGKELGNWIDDITTNTDVDSIKICFGIYTQNMVTNFPTALRDKLGRLTVFLKPIAKNKRNAVFVRASTYTGVLNNGCLARSRAMAAGDTSDNFNLGSVYP